MMLEDIHYVLVFEDPEYDGSDIEDQTTRKLENLRRRYIIAMRKETLAVQEERVGKHIFIKIFCPLERLYQEAEAIRIEMPLLGLVLDNAGEEEEAMIEKKMKKLFDTEIDNRLSAPFQRDCIDLFTDP
ncbi:hypothetical protein X975_23486, partial [Stegodyphus mimosarum]